MNGVGKVCYCGSGKANSGLDEGRNSREREKSGQIAEIFRGYNRQDVKRKQGVKDDFRISGWHNWQNVGECR